MASKLGSNKAHEAFLREPLSNPACGQVDGAEELADPAGDAPDIEWQREWEAHLVATAFHPQRLPVER